VKVAWDDAKNLANQRSHGVSFEEAAELFRSGVDYLEIYDSEHSLVEDRFIAIGPIRKRVIVIVWTERDDQVVRIISARWATHHERMLYAAHLKEMHE
jgi:uncharacterized DUF497 family protein